MMMPLTSPLVGIGAMGGVSGRESGHRESMVTRDNSYVVPTVLSVVRWTRSDEVEMEVRWSEVRRDSRFCNRLPTRF